MQTCSCSWFILNVVELRKQNNTKQNRLSCLSVCQSSPFFSHLSQCFIYFLSSPCFTFSLLLIFSFLSLSLSLPLSLLYLAPHTHCLSLSNRPPPPPPPPRTHQPFLYLRLQIRPVFLRFGDMFHFSCAKWKLVSFKHKIILCFPSLTLRFFYFVMLSFATKPYNLSYLLSFP